MSPTKKVYFAFLFSSIFFINNFQLYSQNLEIPVSTKSAEALKSYNQGLEMLEKFRLQEAVKYFEDAITNDKDFALSYFQKAIAFSLEGNTNKYLENINKAVALATKVSEGERLIILGEKANAANNPDEMKKQFKQLVEKYPQDKRAHYYLGSVLYNQGNYASAVREFEISIELAPDFIPAYKLLAYTYSYLAKHYKAEELIQKYIQLIPEEADPYCSLGDILLKEGKFDEALTAYTKSLEKNSDYCKAYIGIGNNLIFQGRPNEARIEFDKLYNLANNEFDKRRALYAFVCSYIHEGKYDLALEKLQHRYGFAEEMNDIQQMVIDLNLMGDVLLEWGKLDEARSRYKKSIEVSQKSNLPKEIIDDIKHQLLFYEARIDLKKNDVAAAKQKAEKYNSDATHSNNVLEMRKYHGLLGLIALQGKNIDEAINEFKLSDQRDPCILCKAAEAYILKGDKEAAREFWTRAVNFNENDIHFAFVKNTAKKKLAEL
jgi:tetratricopeptide (TPR) repeat protein